MREIKFRAWHKNRKTFLDFDWAVDKLGRVFSILDKCVYDEFTDEIELMQYTGLKDMNGVDIYEGDVVSFGSVWDNGDNEDLDEEIHIGVVEYDPHYAVYNVNCEESGERRFLLMDVVNYDGFGVIGNVHENPELLEAD